MTRFTPAQVVSYFTTKPEDMPKISTPTSQPNYQSITEFRRKLDENLLEVPSDTCNLGHLALAMKPDEFKQLNGGVPFEEPKDPGTKAKITSLTTKSSEAQKAMMPYTAAECLRQYAYEKEEYNKNQATKNVIRNMIIKAVDDK